MYEQIQKFSKLSQKIITKRMDQVNALTTKFINGCIRGTKFK